MLASVETPVEWVDTTVIRHLDAPYSDAALAEPEKTWVDLGDVDLSDFPLTATNSYATWQVKKKGVDFNISALPQQSHAIHRRFMGAARQILGEEVFMDSLVSFSHFTAELDKGESHSFTKPHLDGEFPEIPKHLSSLEDQDYKGTLLRLLGTAVNVLPTIVWNGAVDRDDFYSEADKAMIVRPSVVEAGRIVPSEVPVDRLLIAAPSTVHSGPIANNYVGRRHFLRWQLRF